MAAVEALVADKTEKWSDDFSMRDRLSFLCSVA